MGELHLDVIVRRIKEEFGIDLLVGKPQVVYKETIERPASVEHVLREGHKQHPVQGLVSLSTSSPAPRGEGIFITSRIPETAPEFPYVSGNRRGHPGGVADRPYQGLSPYRYPGRDRQGELQQSRFRPSYPEDGRLRRLQEGLPGCGIPVLLVPIMSLTVTVPNEFLGEIIADLHTRKCQITNIAAQDKITVIQANAPLTKMFGYSTDIRSLSQGRASFSMYFSHYDRMEQDSR